jgi:hypothetical protein
MRKSVGRLFALLSAARCGAVLVSVVSAIATWTKMKTAAKYVAERNNFMETTPPTPVKKQLASGFVTENLYRDLPG